MSEQYTKKELAAFIDAARARLEETVRDEPGTSESISTLNTSSLAKFVDHTQLKLDATPEQISQLCREAVEEGFCTVCVRANYVAQAVKEVQGSDVKVACVVGFHEGTYSTSAKIEESTQAVKDGALELDAVLNRDLLLAGDYEAVYQELAGIRAAAPHPVVLKLILETAQLSKDEVIAASVIAGYAGFDFIKTSTGFNGRGASVEDVKTMSTVAEVLHSSQGQHKMKVKASGGIRSYDDAITMIQAGAERLGTSGGLAIVQQAKAKSSSGNADVTVAGNAGQQSNDAY